MSGPTISPENKALIQKRWFTTDFPKDFGPSTDGNGREAVEIFHPNRYNDRPDRIESTTADFHYRTRFTASKGETLADAVAEDHRGHIFFSTERSGVHSLLGLKPGFEGRLQKWFTGPQSLATLPGKPDAIDVTDHGDKVAVAIGSKVMTWTAGAGLQELATMPSRVHTMSYLPDGTLAVCTKKDGADGGRDTGFSAILPDTTVPVALDASEFGRPYRPHYRPGY